MDLRALTHDQQVILIDDDPHAGPATADALRRDGFLVEVVSSLDEAAAAIGELHPEAIVVQETGGGEELAAAVRKVRGLDRRAAVIAISNFGTVEAAVAAMREGADEVLVKPVIDRELRLVISREIERRRLRGTRPHGSDSAVLGSVLGSSAPVAEIRKTATRIAATKATVLITGESGTGKSLVARAIHRASPRCDGPFVEVSCGSLSETLLESELFGHVEGAFTGAIAAKKGRFLAADGGTVFLDEINSASPSLQLKLLRVLQEKRFEAVGSDETVEVDVRLVLASNQPLEPLVASGKFRQDLYYRINVVALEMPPLRDRPGDIPLLAESFVRRFAAEHGKQIAGIASETMAALARHAFPGNVRELENAVERGVVMATGHLVRIEDLPKEFSDGALGSAPRLTLGGASQHPSEHGETTPTLLDAVRTSERQAIEDALRRAGGNRAEAARLLGVDRTTLYKKLRSLGVAARRAA